MLALEGAEVRDKERVATKLLGVVDELPRIPLHGAHGEVVEAELVVALARGSRRGGHGRERGRCGSGGKKGPAGQR